MLNKIYRLANTFEKLASFPTINEVKNLINKALVELINSNQNIMKGVKGISNVEMQNNIEYIHVSFVVLVESNSELQNTLQANKPFRDQTIKSYVLNSLNQTFPGFQFKLDFGEISE